MSRRKKATQEETIDRDLISHLSLLGLKTVEEYRDWCAANGFSRRLDKNWKARCRERYHVQSQLATQRLKQKKAEQRRPLEVVKAICDGRLVESDATQPHLQRLCQSVQRRKSQHGEPPIDRSALQRLLRHLLDCRTNLLDSSPVVTEYGNLPGNTYLEALALLAVHHKSWVRPVEDWKRTSHNGHRQFASLARHLLVRYEMPAFFDSVWFAGRSRVAATRRQWFLHVARGQNLRHCDLPITLSKRMAHFVMQSPSDVTIDQALRWGQVRGLGGDERLARALLGTRLGDSFVNEDFWVTIIRWFISHPMLDRAHVGPMIDYLHNQRFEAPGGLGLHRDEGPPQPNLTMRGRSPETLLRQVQQWHQRLTRDNTQLPADWQPSGIKPLEFYEGTAESKNLKCWTIQELLSSKALLTEGRKLHHCVASYAWSCARGICSIWTMEAETIRGKSKQLTIEVNNSRRLICQARGNMNALPTQIQMLILKRWATEQGLTIANYV